MSIGATLRRGRWIALAAGAATLAVTAFVLLRPRYEYVWQGVAGLPETVNAVDREDYEPNITPDGASLIFTRGKAGQNADLFIAPFVAGHAGPATPLASINTEFDEVDGSLTRDGKLYFYSNRPGSLGGFDVYVAPQLPDGTFGTPVNLGETVNSTFNDYDPCVSRDGKLLYFSSNRHSAGSEEDYDLYVCLNQEGKWSEPKALAPLNTPQNEWEPMLDRSGRVLYFTSNRPRTSPDGMPRTDYDLFAATLGPNEWGPPRDLGEGVNSTDDEFDPCVSPKDGTLFFVRGTRLGTGYDVDIWEGGLRAVPLGAILQPGRLPPQLVRTLALLAAALLLAGLLVHGWSRLTTMQRCMLGSVAVHCLAGWILSLTALLSDFSAPRRDQATFTVYTDLPEYLEQEAMIAAMFESKVDVKASEAPMQGVRISEPAPKSLPATPQDVVERPVAPAATPRELAPWRPQPAELVALAQLPNEAQSVSEEIREARSTPPAIPAEAPPEPAPAVLVAAPAVAVPARSGPTSLTAQRSTVEPVRPPSRSAPSTLTELVVPAEDVGLAVAAPAAVPQPATPRTAAARTTAASASDVIAPALAAPREAQADGPEHTAVRTTMALQRPAEGTAPLLTAMPERHETAGGESPLATDSTPRQPVSPRGPAVPTGVPVLATAPPARVAAVAVGQTTATGFAPVAQAPRLTPPTVGTGVQPLTKLATVTTLAASVPATATPSGTPRMPTGMQSPRATVATLPTLAAPALPRTTGPVGATTVHPEPRATVGRAPHVADRERLSRIDWGGARSLGPTINSLDQDYEPNLSPDGATLYLTRGAAGSNANILVSTRLNGAWTPPQALTNLNSDADEIDASVDATGTRLVFYSNRPDGVGAYDLYMSLKRDGVWQTPTNMGAVVNSEYNDYDPCVSYDGRTLLFSSNRGSLGSEDNYDIHACAQNADGSWGTPVRLPFNTNVNEWEPALSSDGLSLYFSSNRPGGQGGYDVWVSHQRGGQWQTPVNLGPGVNTNKDELDAVVSPDGTMLFYATNRQGGQGSFDIWQAQRTLTVGSEAVGGEPPGRHAATANPSREP